MPCDHLRMSDNFSVHVFRGVTYSTSWFRRLEKQISLQTIGLSMELAEKVDNIII